MKKLGIIGGLGPLASADLYKKITEFTKVTKDQDHIHIIIDSNTNIQDRTQYILSVKNNINSKINPLSEIKKSIDTLEQVGCNVIIMACNTAHYFENEIIDYTNAKFISMPKATVAATKKMGFKKVTLLATDGTLIANTYSKYLNLYDIQNIPTNKNEQELIMSIIYDYVKSGLLDKLEDIKEPLNKMINNLKNQGAQALILACTELPIAFKKLKISNIKIVNSTNELAKAAIKQCL